MIISTSGLRYETKIERIELGRTIINLEMLADVDQTIDQLFALYLTQGKTELFEDMCPYFGTLWAAGKVLASVIETQIAESEFQKTHAKTDRILEVGCGLALPSLLLSKYGWSVAATDLHPDVPLFLDANKMHNHIVGPTFVPLDWGIAASESQANEKWDLILASDVLYDKAQPEALGRFLRQNLAETGRALIADPGRNYVEGFFDLLRVRGFDVTVDGLFGVIIAEIRFKKARK